MIKVCITADYEVFLGENYGSVYDVLIKPASYIAKKFSENNIPITFFVDVLYFDFLKKNNRIFDFELLVNNVNMLYDIGHSIELHVHPHWLHTRMSGNRFEFDEHYYRLSDDSSESQVKEILQYSKRILVEEIMKSKKDYTISSFRAGGWCFAPEKHYIRALSEIGIGVDTSVIRNLYSGEKEVEYYDYRKCPSDDLWPINQLSGICNKCDDVNTDLIEFPVYSISGLKVVFHKIKNILERRLKHFEQPKKMGKSCLRTKSPAGRLKRVLFDPLKFSLDNVDDISFYVKEINKMGKGKEDRYICLYFHPKLLDEQFIDKVFDELCLLDDRYVKFIHMKEIVSKEKNDANRRY